MARMTLFGMYQYDQTLLDGVILPDGFDNEVAKETIIFQSGDLYPYYQVPPQLKHQISNWFTVRYNDFAQMYKALHAEYSPIENYDRTENSKRNLQDSGRDTETLSLGSSNTQTHSGADTLHVEQTLDEETTNQVSAYDTSSLQNRNASHTTGTPESTNTNSYASQVKEEKSGADTRQTNYGKGSSDTFESRVHGNIGVTTAQQMIEAELEMRRKYDLYKIIAQMFEEYFIVQIY